jgi:hypothetical protein
MFIPLLLVSLGITFSVIGYSRWKGRPHGSYLAYGYFRTANYMSIPLGISSIFLGLAVAPFFTDDIQIILLGFSQLFFVFGLVFSWKLFEPIWVKWLKDNHSDLIPYLQMDVRDNGWHYNNLQELEEWVRQIRHRYKVDEPTGT